MLMETDQVLVAGAGLDMRFVLPVHGKDGAEFSCRGVVLRVSSPQEPGGSRLVALTIEQSRLRRPVS